MEGDKGNLGGDRSVLYLDCGGICMPVHIRQNS